MTIRLFLDMLLTACVVVFVVDVSGFSDFVCRVWAKVIHVRKVESVKPFTCSLCSTWWACLVVALCERSFTFEAVAVAAGLALFADTIAQAFFLVREAIGAIIRLCYKLIDRI